jgi:hypothetical protein
MLIPAAFVFACAAIVINGILRAPKAALVGALLIAAGTPIYLLSRNNSTAGALIQPVCNEEPTPCIEELTPCEKI